MKTMALWVLRKALYTAAGTVLAFLAVKFGAVDPAHLEAVTLVSVVSGLGASIVGDLRRAFAADFLQVVSGTDPRVDG